MTGVNCDRGTHVGSLKDSPHSRLSPSRRNSRLHSVFIIKRVILSVAFGEDREIFERTCSIKGKVRGTSGRIPNLNL